MLIESESLDRNVWEWLPPTPVWSYFSFHFVVLNVRWCQSCHVEVGAKDCVTVHVALPNHNLFSHETTLCLLQPAVSSGFTCCGYEILAAKTKTHSYDQKRHYTFSF